MLDAITLMELLDDTPQNLIILLPEKQISILAELRKSSGSNDGNFLLCVKILGAKRVGEKD